MNHALEIPARLEPWNLTEVDDALSALRADMLEVESRFGDRWHQLPLRRRESARNLLHYLAMRRRDVRPLQAQLAGRGLSSLGRAESGVLASLDAVRSVVRRLAALPAVVAAETFPLDVARGRELLERNTRALLGPPPAGRAVAIMVTMSEEAAHEYEFVRSLLAAGMDCMRINAAHDDAAAWDRMLIHLDRARRALGRPCRVSLDIAGPKLRTGPVHETAVVTRWKPARNRFGRVVRPARIWLTAREQPRPAPQTADAVLPVASDWLGRLACDDTVKLFDARDSMREMRIVECLDGGAWAESNQTAYVVPGTTLHLTRATPQTFSGVGAFLPQPGTLRLSTGDTLILSRDLHGGAPAVLGPEGDVLQPASIGITLPEVFEDVQPGEPIWFDDGMIGGVIRAVRADQIDVEITRTRAGGAKLGADKGINLPASALRLPALTEKDREDLRVMDGRVDLVGYSFVRSADDVRTLQSYLGSVSEHEVGMVLKIETQRAFEQLPALLLAAMDSPSSGVMIARGDLAIECGYERLAEVQEQILWMAEASHTPVIWATQVLESLAKEGMPSRAEITDAAMSERAECVMLNKGPVILDAVHTLNDILTRMQAHQQKKASMLRELGLARRFLTGA